MHNIALLVEFFDIWASAARKTARTTKLPGLRRREWTSKNGSVSDAVHVGFDGICDGFLLLLLLSPSSVPWPPF